MSDLISASSLNRYCGHARVLSKKRVRPPAQRRAMEKGTVFHKLVEDYFKLGVVPDEDQEEPFEWFERLRVNWPGPGIWDQEVAYGLAPDGKYVEVNEPKPHVYVAKDGSQLLTAGRGDGTAMGWSIVYSGEWVVTEGCLLLWDWKTGQNEVEHPDTNLQFWSLALAAASKHGAKSAQCAVYYARTGTWKWSRVVSIPSPEASIRFEDVKRAATLDETPRTGRWCFDCWEKRGCAAWLAKGKRAA